MVTTHAEPKRQGSIVTIVIVAFVLLGGVAVGGLLAYRAGASNRIEVHTGVAVVGDKIFTVEIGDWSYGASDSVAWIASDEAWHDSGWPNCLRSAGHSPVTFGATEVSGPTGVSWRQVVWVDCR